MTHYVVVRADMPFGFVAAQIVHAAGESSPGGLSTGTNAVVLAATSAQLHALEAKLADLGIDHVAIREPDEPWRGALTAIGLAPVRDRASLRDHLGHLPLYGRKRAPVAQ